MKLVIRGRTIFPIEISPARVHYKSIYLFTMIYVNGEESQRENRAIKNFPRLDGRSHGAPNRQLRYKLPANHQGQYDILEYYWPLFHPLFRRFDEKFFGANGKKIYRRLKIFIQRPASCRFPIRSNRPTQSNSNVMDTIREIKILGFQRNTETRKKIEPRVPQISARANCSDGNFRFVLNRRRTIGW